jgi:hypothetical protein
MARQRKHWSSLSYIMRKGAFAELGIAHKAKPLRRIMRHMAITLIPPHGKPRNVDEVALLEKAWRGPRKVAAAGRGDSLHWLAAQYRV